MHEGEAKGSDLIIYPDGTLYHIDLKRDDNIPPNLFLVGSAQRVEAIASHFDRVTFKHQNEARPEFAIAVGEYQGVPMAAFSCGIGPDNMEIVLNEFHALFEYDHKQDVWGAAREDINIIRIGTSGTSIADIPIGAIATSTYAIGLDNLGAYYPSGTEDANTDAITEQFLKTPIGKVNTLTYTAAASSKVIEALHAAAKELGEEAPNYAFGMTTSSPGFFAPEGRSIGRIKTKLTFDEFLSTIQEFTYQDQRIVNHEMEASALFLIGNEILNYNVGAICLVIDNLANNAVLEKDAASKRMNDTISIALNAMLVLVGSQ